MHHRVLAWQIRFNSSTYLDESPYKLNTLASGILLKEDLHIVRETSTREPQPYAVITSRNLLERIININNPSTAGLKRKNETEKERHTVAHTILGILAEEAGQKDLVSALEQIKQMKITPGYESLYQSQLLQIKRNIYQCQATNEFLAYYDSSFGFTNFPTLPQKTGRKDDPYQRLQNALINSQYYMAQRVIFAEKL